jgi:hypothetical protein
MFTKIKSAVARLRERKHNSLDKNHITSDHKAWKILMLQSNTAGSRTGFDVDENGLE